MEFTIEKDCFVSAVSDVIKAIPNNTTLPILKGIKITVQEDGIILVGSNSNITIEKFIPCVVEDKPVILIHATGTIVVNAKYLFEIIKKLPDNISLKKFNNNLEIQSGGVETKLNCYEVNDYPLLPHSNSSNMITLEGKELSEIIKQTFFSVSKSETRPILTGVNITFTDGLATYVATDSYRLAITKQHTPVSKSDFGSITIPSSSLAELLRLTNNYTGSIDIHMSDNHIIFIIGDITLFSTVLSGYYPNVNNLIPTEFKTKVIIDTKSFLQGIERANLLASDLRHNSIQLEIINDSKIEISSNSTEIGQITEIQDIEFITGKSHQLKISFGGQFMIDALKVIRTEKISIKFNGAMRPILIEPINNPDALYLISPVRSY
ncbi:DNA polymerase III subunit beta [Bacillus mycoides]|uniref:DNA polymerase III subunit beta n=1 Tax=Bacillus mycoides TaxID=1405 RepID=UPI003D04507B